MLPRIFLILAISVVYSFYACSGRKDAEEIVSDTVTYAAVQPGSVRVKIRAIRASGIISLQKLLIHATLENTSASALQINFELAELNCRNETRSLPVKFTATKGLLVSNETADVVLEFEPVQSQMLFQQTSLRGDLDDKYRLSIPFTANDGKSDIVEILLEADAAILVAANDRFGITQNTTPFTIAEVVVPEDNPDGVAEVHFTEAHEKLRINDNEILSQGFWAKFFTFNKHDTLFVRMRVVNQSMRSITIYPSLIKVLDEGDSISQANNTLPEILRLKNADRAELLLKFPVGLRPRYQMSIDDIRFDSDKVSVIGSSIIFKPLELSPSDR